MFMHSAPPAASSRPSRAFGIRALLASAAGLTLAVTGIAFSTTAASAATANDWICHGPIGKGNYVYVPPGSLSGHEKHDTDIVPPGLIGASGDPIFDGGQNWNSTTQATYLPGAGGKTACEVPDGPVDTSTVNICSWQGDALATWQQQAILKSEAATIAANPTGNDRRDIIPAFDLTDTSGGTPTTTSVGLNSGESGQMFDGTAIFANGCVDAGAMIKICVASSSEAAPYSLTSVRFNAVTSAGGNGTGEGSIAKDGNGIYPTAGWGNIVPAIAKGEFPYYLTGNYAGVNAAAGADWISKASCPTQIISVVTPSPTPTTTPTSAPSSTPTTTPSTAPAVSTEGPTDTGFIVPLIEALASGSPLAAETAIAVPLITPEPAVASNDPRTPESETVPTVVNAGGGGGVASGQLPIWALVMAVVGAVGIIGASVRLATSKRTDLAF